MPKLSFLGVLWIGLGLLLCACSLEKTEPATPAPEAVFTSAAQTAEARRIERFAQTATLPAEALIATSAFSTPTPTYMPNVALESPATSTESATAVSKPTDGSELGEFVADISISDGSKLAPNQPFQKTWRIMNSGQTTWTTDYALVFIDGALMGAQPTVPLPKSVAPGENVDITIDMVAPPEPGAYRGFWELRNASGKFFGFGPNGDGAIWVDIVVEGEAASRLQSTTPSAAGVIGSVSLSVDNAKVSGKCPHTFIFTARISLSNPSTLIFALEGGSLSGENMRLPQPASQNLGKGEYPIIYEVTIPADTVAWARLHVIAPINAYSNQVDFSLTCG